MPYQQLLDRHSMMVFCRHIIEIDQGYPREQHKARMLPLFEEFKRRFNASIGTENNEFALLIQLSEQYFFKLKEAQTKCSTCEGFVKLIEKRRGDTICSNSFGVGKWPCSCQRRIN